MVPWKYLIMQLTLDSTLLTIVILIFSVIVHEVAHGYAANALGDPTARLAGRLTLNPMPHIDLIGSVLIPAFLVFTHAGILFGWAKPVPYNPYNLKNQRWGEAIVAFAGPATNLFLAILFAFVVRAAAAGILPAAAGAFALTIVFVNLFLGLFNLIPFPPFDGYTVLASILPYRYTMKMRSLEQRIMSFGSMGLIAVLFFFIFFFSAPFYNFVFFVFRLLVGA